MDLSSSSSKLLSIVANERGANEAVFFDGEGKEIAPTEGLEAGSALTVVKAVDYDRGDDGHAETGGDPTVALTS